MSLKLLLTNAPIIMGIANIWLKKPVQNANFGATAKLLPSPLQNKGT
jgi:hypothetical protein